MKTTFNLQNISLQAGLENMFVVMYVFLGRKLLLLPKGRLLAKTSSGHKSVCSGSLIYHGHIYTRGWKGQSNYVKLLACGMEARSLVISDWFDFHFLFGGGTPAKCLIEEGKLRNCSSAWPPSFLSDTRRAPRPGPAWVHRAAGPGLERTVEHCFINFTKLYFWAQNSCGFQLCPKMLHN